MVPIEVLMAELAMADEICCGVRLYARSLFGLRRTWNSLRGGAVGRDVGHPGDALEVRQEVVRHVVGHHVETDALRAKAELDDGRGVGIEGLDGRRVDPRREQLDRRGHLRRDLVGVGVLVAALVEEHG